MNSLHNSQTDSSADDKMTLLELWQMFCAGWHLILGGLVAGLLVAGGYLAITPTQYEATLLIKIGKTGTVDSEQQIEKPGDVIERLNAPDFAKAVLESLDWNSNARERLFRSSLQATSPADKHVRIRLRNSTPADARRAAEATFAALVGIHRGLIETVLAKKELELASTATEIAEAEVMLNRLEMVDEEIRPGDHREIMMLLETMQNQKDRLRTLHRQESEIKADLNPKFTVMTTAVEPVAVSDSPVHPKARRVWLLAVVGGLLLGLLLITLRSLVDDK